MDGFIANSRVISDRLVTDGVPRAKITIVNEGVDVDRIDRLQAANVRAAFYLPMQAPVVGNVAALVPHKGQHHLIDAAAITVRQVPDARFVIVGDGELRQALEDQIRHKHLERHVFLAGFRDDALELTKGFDLFVMSSTSEGMCTALVDAMAASKAAVATDAGAIPEVMVDGETGFLVPIRDHEAMAARIVQLLKNPKLRARMGEAALQRARERFTVDRMVDGTQAAYEVASSRRRERSADVRQPALQEPALGLLPRQGERPRVRRARVGDSSKPTAQVGSRRVREVVLVEIAAGENRVDDREPRRRTVAHGHRRGAVQLDDRRRIGAQQHVVQADDLRPVRGGGRGALRHARRRSPPAACRDRTGVPSARARRARSPRQSARGSSACGPVRRAAPARLTLVVRAARRDSWSSINASRPIDFGFRQQLHQETPESDAPRPTDRDASATRRPTPNSPR